MRIFLSWSGELSKAVATTLKGWLPIIVSPAELWMSEHDIQAGDVWENELTDNLRTTDCGVLLFEAGILSKSARATHSTATQ